MYRKPSYCCNCGDKVERVEWHIWNSSRFCELCETEYVFDEWWPRAVIFVFLIFGFTGIGFQYGGDRKTVVIRDDASVPRRMSIAESTRESTAGRESPAAQPENRGSDLKESTDAPSLPASVEKRAITTGTPSEPQQIYYCGAITKKGTPCMRRVKKGEKCWQHRNVAAHSKKESEEVR